LAIAVVGLISMLGLTQAAHAALRAPGLQSPLANASVQALPTFSWRAVKGAAQYEFQLSADVRFSSIVTGTGRGKGSQRTRNTAATLEATVPDGKYYWRVRAISKSARAGAWTKPRVMTKAWTDKATLQSPIGGEPIAWPSEPLVLRWAPVPHATHYLVTIATDPSLAQGLVGVGNKPAETQGTVFAFQGPLANGRYYWAVTPVDGGDQRGTRSKVGSFEWSWNTATATRVVDLNDTGAVVDPLLDWDLVPGAARYEVEVNPDDDFAAGSRVCCKENVIGTSLSPLRVLPNNSDFAGSTGYHWRVRAFDADGNPGRWNVGPLFKKLYDQPPAVAVTVPGIAVETVPSADAATASPLVTWSPVPGAAQYQVQWTVYSGGVCGWSNASGPIKTSALAWTPLSPTGFTGVPGGIGITQTMRPNGTVARAGQPFSVERAYSFPSVDAFENGKTYCVRVRALSDDSYRENDNKTSQVISQWTQSGGGENVPAFTYGAPPPTSSDPAAAVQLPAPVYQGVGDVVRTPVLRWAPVSGARRYFVLIARDVNFTNVIDAAFTAMPAYAPNLVLEDEQDYYWAVVPASQSDGSGISGGPTAYNPQTFRKRSNPPSLLEPGAGLRVATQPRFRWTPAESAQKYRVQVSADPQFGDLIDDVVTAATAYTSQTPYPADTALYWRVRAEQHQTLQGASERVELRWSQTGAFVRGLQPPTSSLLNPTKGDLFPAFTWTAVPGAISYDIHFDESDGDPIDFTVRSPAFAPVKFFGTGIFTYKIRANFATRSGSVASAYSAPPQTFTRLISAPPGARLTRTKTRVVFGWTPADAARRYIVQVSATDSFARVADTVRTDNSSWAPDMTKPVYHNGGPIYWRVATIDEGNNIGAWASGSIGVKRLTVIVRGNLKRNASGRITVSVRYKGKAVGAAMVRATGAGVKPKSKRTTKRGAASFVLRPTKAGKVTVTVSRSGYETKSVTKGVK
jgi:hypothetical protein